MKKLAIFASGNGSNAQRITEYFQSHPEIKVALILSNKPDAFVLQRARDLGVPSATFNREAFYQGNRVLDELMQYGIEFIVLAGFLWLVPENILKAFAGRILNIHPALLPKYGGKGMYGGRVHQAVIDNGEKESGISIHRVNEKYDEGEVIFQARVGVDPDDTAESLAQKVHALEYEHFPLVIEREVIKL
jgi:phosphoribosylglycinamide formyltransferase-1